MIAKFMQDLSVHVQKLKAASCAFVACCSLLSVAGGEQPADNKQTVAPEGMVVVPAGEFSMGGPQLRAVHELRARVAKDRPCCEGLRSGFRDCEPEHRVRIDGFFIDKTEVTNAEFAKFVAATKYVTVAERPLDAKEFPGVPLEKLQSGSVVFTPPKALLPGMQFYDWWSFVPGASWQHPTGPKSDLVGKENYPVVHVAYEDALAYAKWSDKRLPTEAEWEWAARGGLEKKFYPWGDSLKVDGKWQCNAFQGEFPNGDKAEDGFAGIAPVSQYPPNPFGLFDVSGNVWEWCSDYYRADTYPRRARDLKLVINPTGPADSLDPDEPNVVKRVHRGGSYLCSEEYCARYLLGTRGKGEVQTSSCHVGFRCVRDFPKKSN